MDAAYGVREFQEPDWEAWREIWYRSFPAVPRSLEETRRAARRAAEDGPAAWWRVAELRGSGKAVAVVSLSSQPIDPGPEVRWIGGLVDPAHRRRGIGSRLLEAAVTESRRCGVRILRCRAPAKPPESLGFLQRREFRELRRSVESSLDPHRADLDALDGLARRAEAGGIEVRSLAEGGPLDRPAVESLIALNAATVVDVPRMGGPASFTPDQFERWVLANPSVRREAIFVARVGGRPVAISYASVEADDPTRMRQEFTGTRREYRGRGLGTLLKLKVVEYARAHGVRHLSTSNDLGNAPIRAINDRIGFRAIAEWSHLERRVSPEPVEGGRATGSP